MRDPSVDWFHYLGGVDYRKGHEFGRSFAQNDGEPYEQRNENLRWAYWWGWAIARRECERDHGRERVGT